jgi:hypothetical protein
MVRPSWVGCVVEQLELGYRVLDPGTVQGSCQRRPHLKKQHSFKDNVSWMFHELGLNGHFVSKQPKCPGLSNEKQPHTSSKSTRQTRDDGEKLGKISGAPAASQQLAGNTPRKDRRRA